MATQDTAENYKDRLRAAEQRLLAEGVPSYFDVIMALREFEQSAQKRCRRVLSEGLEEFAGAIGVPLNATMIEDYAEPGRISALVKSDETYLGVKIPLQNVGTGYATLVLRRAGAQNLPEPVPEVYVGIDLDDRTLFNRLWELVKLAEPRAGSSYRETIELYKPVPPDRIPNFADILADLLGEWSCLWQRVGGLQGTAMAR